MTIKEATLKVMNDWCDKPTRQIDIVKEVVRLTGYSYESCRGNSFRNPNAIPEIWTNYQRVMVDGLVCYVKGESVYKHNYNKPNEYYELLTELNDSNKIFTLSGTSSNCMKVLDNSKTIKVDKSKHSNADYIKDIYTINEPGSYNLDFEGILTKRKIDYINKIPADKILLTFRSSKRDHLIDNIKLKSISSFQYKSGRDTMKCYLFSSL